MATLTWKDVAGPVAAPDFSSAASLISQGISQLGTGVSGLGDDAEQRRQSDLAKQLMAVKASREGLFDMIRAGNAVGQDIRGFRHDQRIADQDAAATAWGAVQSQLEGAALQAALEGKDINSIFENEMFRQLPEMARGLAADSLSDTFREGISIRDTRLDRDRRYQLERRQDARAEASARRQAAADRRQAQIDRARLKEMDPLIDVEDDVSREALTRKSAEVTQMLAATDTSEFAGKSVMKILTEEIGINKNNYIRGDARSGVAEISNAWNDANKRLEAEGYPRLDPSVMAFAASKNAGNSNWFGTTEPTEWMINFGRARGQALKARDELYADIARAERGERVTYMTPLERKQKEEADAKWREAMRREEVASAKLAQEVTTDIVGRTATPAANPYPNVPANVRKLMEEADQRLQDNEAKRKADAKARREAFWETWNKNK